MQQKDQKTELFAQILGAIITELRLKKGYSINQLAHEFDLDVGNTSRVEKGSIEVKFVTLWKISEAIGIKPSDLIKILENKLGDKFKFYDD